MKIYQAGSYAITVEHGTITGFELVYKIGGRVPKHGQEFNAYLHKCRLTWEDVTDITQVKVEAPATERNDHIHPTMQPFVNGIKYGGCL
ncbi:hypothetical protein UFOVP1596_29 [uncultured Caudovirales phage]|uniref:Uncharacterized protein n=1 Tax=uncultured Caudovirales phage TaxID=2100421 RepID=A0A6J5SSN6_9CAUD|nr:hypothetical protein UFOVP1596_29 [uncultured Caudovirales phage]